MLAALVVELRSRPLICGGHRAVALENQALRQQLTVFRRTVRDDRGDEPFGSGTYPNYPSYSSRRRHPSGQSTGISTSVKLPGVAAFTAATTSATCGCRA